MSKIDPLLNIQAELHSLDSKMRVIAQRMKIIEKNEQIIGKTLITHNKKLKDLENMIVTGSTAPREAVQAPSVDAEELKELVSGVSAEKADFRVLADSIKQEITFVKERMDKLQEQVNEMKYVLDSVNPLEYITIEQARELIDELLSRKAKK